MVYNQRILFFAHARSGSSSLFQILCLHPQLTLLEEPFNEHFMEWAPPGEPNYRDLISDRASLDVQLELIFARYHGIKVLEYQLSTDLYTHLLLKPEYKIIFLRRKNLLQAVVSGMLAEQTDLWKKWDMERPLHAYYANLTPLSIPEIAHHVTHLKQRLDYYERVIHSRRNGSFIPFLYEDLYFGTTHQQARAMEQLWCFLELQSIPIATLQQYLRPEQAKINSLETYAFLPNADAINHQLGNDETGWLYS